MKFKIFPKYCMNVCLLTSVLKSISYFSMTVLPKIRGKNSLNVMCWISATVIRLAS